MVKFIESELVSLKKEVNEMWTLVYNQLDRAGEAVLTFNRDQAQQVIVREKRVNAFELKIDSDVEDTIALYNPVAIDLRFVLAMFKINSDLERLGDFAEGIARFVVSLAKRNQPHALQRNGSSPLRQKRPQPYPQYPAIHWPL